MELCEMLRRVWKLLKSNYQITGLDLASKESEYKRLSRLFNDIRGVENDLNTYNV